MRVLVTGGAGYIGSFIVRALLERGHEPLVIDDLTTGHRVAAGVEVRRLECGETDAVAAVMEREGIAAVVHLAALSLVGDSVRDPGRYWRRNVGQAAGLLDACRRAGVRRFVLSSSAAVYGEPETVPIREDHPLRPTNPYGATKRAIEEMLAHFSESCGLGWVALRYFNAAGAEPDGSIGEDHRPESHLIPLAIGAAAGRRPPLMLHGDDYETPDGTGLRDYVHVRDLATAHCLALDWIEAHPGSCLAANLGAGEGRSVKQVVATVAEVVGRAVPHSVGPRRAGDPAVLVATIDRAQRELGWRPERSRLREIVADAWAWHRSHPEGYPD